MGPWFMLPPGPGGGPRRGGQLVSDLDYTTLDLEPSPAQPGSQGQPGSQPECSRTVSKYTTAYRGKYILTHRPPNARCGLYQWGAPFATSCSPPVW